jgi:HD-like signal output (HDOD) protein
MPAPTPAQTLSLTQPLPDLAAWTARFMAAEIPVLSETAEALETMRAREDDVDANLIGEMVSDDPLMTLKVLAHAAMTRTSRMVTDTETVTAALVMMGISPFFRAFGAQPTVEQRLAQHPQALQGLLDTVRRAHRSAKFALGFAVQRNDHDAAIIHEAALLHDFAEMLLWCHAPTLAQEVRRAQQADSTLRSRAVQRQVLNVELAALQQSLMKAWRLPDLLIQIADTAHADHPGVKSVLLAVRLARHSAAGWDNAAIPDDVADIAALLNLSYGAALNLIENIEH